MTIGILGGMPTARPPDEEVIAELRGSRPGSPQLISYHATLLLQLDRRAEAADLYKLCAGGPGIGESCRSSAVELLIELDRPGEAADLLLDSLADDDLDQPHHRRGREEMQPQHIGRPARRLGDRGGELVLARLLAHEVELGPDPMDELGAGAATTETAR